MRLVPEVLRNFPVSWFSEEMVVGLAADHPLSSLEAFGVGDLERAPYLDRLACELRDTVLRCLKEDEIRLRVAASVAREDWMLRLLVEGAGIAVLPASLVDGRNLVTRPFAGGRFRRDVSLAVPLGREDTAAVRAFVHAARHSAWFRGIQAPDRDATPAK